jgi:hypothetical protein
VEEEGEAEEKEEREVEGLMREEDEEEEARLWKEERTGFMREDRRAADSGF